MALIRLAAASFWTTFALVALVTVAAITITVQAFGLRITGGIALYFVIWWTVLFAVLPFGVRSQAEAGDVVSGSEPGAPAAPGAPREGDLDDVSRRRGSDGRRGSAATLGALGRIVIPVARRAGRNPGDIEPCGFRALASLAPE
jgi:hypothetical protein